MLRSSFRVLVFSSDSVSYTTMTSSFCNGGVGEVGGDGGDGLGGDDSRGGVDGLGGDGGDGRGGVDGRGGDGGDGRGVDGRLSRLILRTGFSISGIKEVGKFICVFTYPSKYNVVLGTRVYLGTSSSEDESSSKCLGTFKGSLPRDLSWVVCPLDARLIIVFAIMRFM